VIRKEKYAHAGHLVETGLDRPEFCRATLPVLADDGATMASWPARIKFRFRLLGFALVLRDLGFGSRTSRNRHFMMALNT